MPQPKIGDVHIDRALTNVSLAFMQSAEQFIARQVFPEVPVENRSDKYYTYTREEWRRDQVRPRAPGTESAGGGFKIGNDSFSCDVYAFHKDISDQIRANADSPIDLENNAAEFLAQLFLIQREVTWAADFFATGIWTTDVVGATDFTQWDDNASDPEVDVDTGKTKVLQNTGIMPNTLVVGWQTHQALKRHPLVAERYKYVSAESITTALLARYLEIDRYLVARASRVTSEEDAASTTNAMILGKHALLCHVPPNPGLLTPAAGYTFVWREFTGASDAGMRVKNFRLEQLESDRIEGEFAYDHKKVSADLGYFFSAAVA